MNMWETRILKTDTDESMCSSLDIGAKSLSQGDIVGIPTETVYGLAANGMNEDAVKKIFVAKGRPQDNPLILHISDMNMLFDIAYDIPNSGIDLGKKFWPGPLTMIFFRKPRVPSVVSAGLDTVAVRMPAHSTARKLIEMCGFPLAAPSANISGAPSPTCAQHVYEDLNGKIPFIIDGGDCEIGLESTVIDFTKKIPTILRPGKITKQDIESALGIEVGVDPGISEYKEYDGSVSSPGMKYKHYSPKANVVMFHGTSQEYSEYVNSKNDVHALCFEEDIKYITVPYICYGKESDFDVQGKELFSSLRQLDKIGAKFVVAHAPRKDGMGLSVYNRLIKSAGFEVVK